ncbi:AhpC/TSA family protein [Amycolatopsis rubida]|uniref:thioredoxin-dependent peroxiredoxin n=1 Tax=Amycolatopsis rubida TaxID=112413 RepID=A0ABX0C035_9PSEU|nr:peroxiredoxin-like family protein [Amycolatopsis sp. M39]MYW93346.1 redoxin family protein [Amycolatopsis rubida]NEC58333.1 AhpC/TSA family protein [Amycolatopsis rubida]OAP28668.1 Thiol-disulfide oxidoreductase ResA [Amycolatopsis sp. M39]
MTTINSTIAERLSALRQGLAGQLPAEAWAAFGGEQADLDAAGSPEGVLAEGAAMPDGELLDVHGDPATLESARHGKPAVVVTYRGAWCPYCNVALRTYQEQLVPVLAERGIGLIAISPQKPDGSLSMAEKNELTFTVLSDPGNQITAALGVLTAPAEAARAAQAALGVDLTEANADGSHGVPMPTVVLVDAEGTIRWIDVHPNYTTRTEVHEIATALDLL